MGEEMIDLDELERIGKTATRGPWGVESTESGSFAVDSDGHGLWCDRGYTWNEDDSSFIAVARNNWQAMIDRIRELEAESDTLRSQVHAIIESCYYRTQAGYVHWQQGKWFGTSVAKNTEPEAYEEAMRAIRHNAGIGDYEP